MNRVLWFVMTMVLVGAVFAAFPLPLGPVGPAVDTEFPLGLFTNNQWIQTDKEDFEAGTLTNVTVTADGFVILDSPTNYTFGTEVNLKGSLSQHAPSAISAPDGRYIIAYEEGSNVKANVYNEDGTLNNTYLIATGGSQPSVYSCTNGTFVIAYVDSSHLIKYRAINPSGTLSAPHTLMLGVPSTNPSNPTIAITTNNVIALTWSNGSTLFTRFFNMSTDTAIAPIYAHYNSRHADTMSIGQYVVIVYECNVTETSSNICMAKYATSPFMPILFKYIANTTAREEYPAIRATTGEYRVAWAVNSGSMHYVQYRKYYSNGTVAHERILASSNNTYFHHITMARGASDMTLISWIVSPTSDGNTANGPIYYSLIDAAGVLKSGGSFKHTSSHARKLDATATYSSFVLAYESADDNSVRYNTYGTMPYPSGTIISQIFDAGRVVSFDSIQSVSDGDVKIAYWIGNSTSGTKTFTTTMDLDAGKTIHKKGRYFQWKAYLKKASTPRLDSVVVNYSYLTPASITISTNSNTILADGAARSYLSVYVRDKYGDPIANQTVYFTTNAGTLGVSSNKTDANGEATNYLIAPSSPATIVVNASAGVIYNTTTIVATSALGGIALIAEPAVLPADNASASTITAIVRKSNGDPFPGQTVTFTTTLGTLSSATNTTDSEGRASVVLAAGTTAGTATVTATSGGESSTVNVTFAPAPATMTLDVADASVPADGTSKTTVTATVLDYENNPYEGATVAFTIDLGTITPETNTTNVNGQASATITAPTGIGTAIITAVVGSISQSASLEYVIPVEEMPEETPAPTPEETPTPVMTPTPGPTHTPEITPMPTTTPRITPTPEETAIPAATPTPVVLITPPATPAPTPAQPAQQDNTLLYAAIGVLVLVVLALGALVLLGGIGGLAYWLGMRSGAKPKGKRIEKEEPHE